jgi:integrase
MYRLKTKTRLYGVIKPHAYASPICESRSMFDKCVDFEAFADVVVKLFNVVTELRKKWPKVKTMKVWSSYLALTIIMLVNGVRVGEAVRAAARFYELGERRLRITASKRGGERTVIIPDFIEREDLEHAYTEAVRAGERAVRLRLKDWLRRALGVNPHSIRYAFIRYTALTGRSPEVIARALGVRKAETVKRYYLQGLESIGGGEGVGALGAHESPSGVEPAQE